MTLELYPKKKKKKKENRKKIVPETTYADNKIPSNQFNRKYKQGVYN